MVFSVRGFTRPQLAPGGVWNEHAVNRPFGLLRDYESAFWKIQVWNERNFQQTEGLTAKEGPPEPTRPAFVRPSWTGASENSDH